MLNRTLTLVIDLPADVDVKMLTKDIEEHGAKIVAQSWSDVMKERDKFFAISNEKGKKIREGSIFK